MDILDFVIRLVSATIWPVTAVLFVAILRYLISNLLTRLRSGKLPGVKLSFDAGPDMSTTIIEAERFEYEGVPSVPQELEINEDNLAGVLAWAATEIVNQSRREAEARLAIALQISGSNPAAAVLTAFRHVEVALRSRYSSAFITQRRLDRQVTADSKSQADYLRGKKFPHAEIFDRVAKMEEFRDKVREGGQPSLSAAAIYVDTAVQMCWVLEPPPPPDPKVTLEIVKNGLVLRQEVLRREARAAQSTDAHRERGEGWQNGTGTEIR